MMKESWNIKLYKKQVNKMIFYSPGYCKPYNQGMPVIYEKCNGEYRKKDMACKKENCDIAKCENFANAPDTVERFRLLEKEYGK